MALTLHIFRDRSASRSFRNGRTLSMLRSFRNKFIFSALRWSWYIVVLICRSFSRLSYAAALLLSLLAGGLFHLYLHLYVVFCTLDCPPPNVVTPLLRAMNICCLLQWLSKRLSELARTKRRTNFVLQHASCWRSILPGGQCCFTSHTYYVWLFWRNARQQLTAFLTHTFTSPTKSIFCSRKRGDNFFVLLTSAD